MIKNKSTKPTKKTEDNKTTNNKEITVRELENIQVRKFILALKPSIKKLAEYDKAK